MLALHLQFSQPLQHLVRRLAAESPISLFALGEQLGEAIPLTSRCFQSLGERAELSLLEFDLSHRPLGNLLVKRLPVLVEQLTIEVEVPGQLPEPLSLCGECGAILIQLLPLRSELRFCGRPLRSCVFRVLCALGLCFRSELITLLLQLFFKGSAFFLHLLSVARKLGTQCFPLRLELHQGLSVALAEACVGIKLSLDNLFVAP